ncbi:MAG: methyltransferase [Clostridia bacterium]|nr:methyltransferase [Clostridia bacterium]
MKNAELLKNEHIETLGNGVGVIVSPEHTFGTDAMLLAHFSAPGRKTVACDFGTGCGIIPFLWARDGLCSKIYAVEIQDVAFSQLERSVEMNALSDRFSAVHSDLRLLKGIIPSGSLDLVTMNPPYKKENAGILSQKDNEKIAKHETMCTLDDICLSASALLKYSGRLCICIRPERLFEAMQSMAKHRLEPKRLRQVISRNGEKPWLCLIEARLGGKSGMTVEKDFVIYDASGNYTEEMESLLKLYREE